MAESVRLQKFLAGAGIASRRKAEAIILEGRVCVNGKVVTELGTKVNGRNDVVSVDGERVRVAKQAVYMVMNKPMGTICSEDDPHHRPRAHDLLPGGLPRLFTIGRLDYNTEGALIFTTDGEMSEALSRPSAGLPKIYQVKIQGPPDEHMVRRFNEGVRLDDGYRTKPAPTELIRRTRTNTWFEVVLTEGKNRQIHRMADACGKRVLKLWRTAFGPVTVGDLRPGESRNLSAAEISALKDVVRSNKSRKKDRRSER
jgi:23S rRNA pseudouridine2605 synthase